ncbi:PHB depolymerase family esterase [Candidimonas sp. SYP-B2681]|nr:PHB depolymerase family esterase [Candidimonas sp. SYP-B2681]RTZ48254.1 PHB depolymerase family esterase [Candidimonas sp. SYP-B2681]
MKFDFRDLMTQATRLTQAGKLQAATAAIQAALGQGTPPERPADEAGEIIDVEMREVNDAHSSTSFHDMAPAPDLEQARPSPAYKAPPRAGRFVAGHYGEGTGRRDYKLYIPPGAGTRPLPLIVMLHGCTQNPDDFAVGTQMNDVAQERDFFVLYPAQSRRANPQGCWNWFKHTHQRRGRGEPALIAGMTRDVMANHSIDADRIYIAGLSAGGAMAAIMGETYPELYAAIGVHSGLAAGSASDLPSALSAMKGGSTKPFTNASGVPTIVFHGDADATVHHGNGEQIIVAAAGSKAKFEEDRVKTRGSRSYTRRVHRGSDGGVVAEHWVVHGAAHAWSGGSANGSYTDPQGPDASIEMLRFFLAHPRSHTIN